jgi:hypothetical protein
MLVFIIVKNKVYVSIPKRAEPGYASSFKLRDQSEEYVGIHNSEEQGICWFS